ncbi:NADP-dependent oxidoreductase [Crossiella cryophila]|uniref:NADPH-dependent curcumin reductase CurA n=1 Tax=Crossiella cryophila TaxID=43355 RepID=A0A7W7C429_9PSEU|nr:NADP-dependent oxidoreductase [Crossiella cryophila]MBB4674186.1 NADPH-dependent curcumin reductase CurA [Crossiella cryophila]
MTTKTREIHLTARPAGAPGQEHFTITEVDLPDPGPGQILVRNTWLSVDPYMRGRMNAGESYIGAFPVGGPLQGHAVGEVLHSAAPEIPVGATVVHFDGWREHALLDAASPMVNVIDPALAPPQAHLGVLGTTGLSAYAAVKEIAPVLPGDVVFVSAAAGAVGSVAGQVARKLGATRVIGSAGGPAKAAKLVSDFGYDAALDYRAGDLPGQLAKAAPDGIDVYIDNVGGDHLQAAIGAIRPHGRIAMVGMISGYNTPVPGPDNLFLAASREATLRGMLVTSYFHLFPEWLGQASGWLADGTLRTAETVVEGFDNTVSAFLSVFEGANTGKMLVRLPG